jgi:hypothetical protein
VTVAGGVQVLLELVPHRGHCSSIDKKG